MLKNPYDEPIIKIIPSKKNKSLDLVFILFFNKYVKDPAENSNNLKIVK